jgi:2-oxoisovalerate dehydrogenase E2 component (dihydrolipoyl transacylase)
VNEYKLPDVGEGLTEAEIVTWKVKVGDVIKVNDIVVEIETAKSLVELPSPYAGTIQALLVPEGETVPVGTPIVRIGEGEASATSGAGGDHAAEAGAQPQAAPEPSGSAVHGVLGEGVTAAQAEEEEHKTLVGYGPRAPQARRRQRRGGATPASSAGEATQEQMQGAFTPGAPSAQVAEPADEPAVPAGVPASSVGEPASSVVEPVETNVRVLAKPPVRKLAKDLGVDLRTLTPSGPNGTVTREDVQAAAHSELSAAESAPAPSHADKSAGGERREPIKGVRKMMAQAMVDSAFTSPHVTEWITVDATRTMELVERLKAHRDFRDVKVSPLLVLAKACLLAMRRTPEINATWDDAAQEVVYKDFVNLGIAAATPRGLVVPNVKNAESMSMSELGGALNELTRTARDGKTQPAEMSGGTFTITNVGVFGVDAGTPIINPGESAILCFGTVRKQPWVVSENGEDRIEIRSVTTLALSFDHRLIDGEKGSRFLADVAGVLEDPASALLL